NLFGGSVDAGLTFGIANFDANRNLIPDTGPGSDATIARSILYGGLQGGFSLGGTSGFYIQVGLSELRPLGVLVSAPSETGVLLEPITGLSIGQFAAGVDFSKSLPSITDPTDLRGQAFQIGNTNETQATWSNDLKSQVATQYKANPSGNLLAV